MTLPRRTLVTPLNHSLRHALLGGLTLAAWAAQAQTTLTLPVNVSAQTFLSNLNYAGTDVNGDSAAVGPSQANLVTLPQFEASLGVLVGAQGWVAIDAGNTLTVRRAPDGGNYTGQGSVRSTWQPFNDASVFVSTGAGALAQVTVDKDNPAASTSAWARLAYSASAADWDRLVGTGSLSGLVTTYLLALKEPQTGGNGGVSAAVSTPDNGRGLTGTVSLGYSMLNHANASFYGDNDQNDINIADDGVFAVHALGDAHTTRLDLMEWACSGDCEAFQLNLGTLQDLLPGQSVQGSVSFMGTQGSYGATYTFTFSDDTSVGAAASQQLQTLSLTVGGTAAAVPEPSAAWLLVAGLFVVARRRPGAQNGSVCSRDATAAR